MIGTLAAGMDGGCYRGPGRSYAEGFAETLLLAARDVRTSSANASRMTARVPRIEAGDQRWLADRHGVRTRVKRVAPPSGEHFDDAFEHGEQDGREHEFGSSRERLDSTASR